MRLWHHLPNVARLLRQVGQRIAGELRCARCGLTLECSARAAARYLQEGWPKCHGETMVLTSQDVPGATRTALAIPGRAHQPRRS